MAPTDLPTWTVGDMWPPLSGTLVDNGVPVALTDADGPLVSETPVARICRSDKSVFTREIVILAETGKWSMPWHQDDLTVAGYYEAVIPVHWRNGDPETFGTAIFYVQNPAF